MTQELAPKEKREAQEPERTRPGRTYVPDVDIYEDEQALWLWADMPGVGQNRVDVEVHNGVLTIRGQVSLEEYEGLTPIFTPGWSMSASVLNRCRSEARIRGDLPTLM